MLFRCHTSENRWLVLFYRARDGVAWRARWVMLVGLRNAVRSDDIWVPGSRRYTGLPTVLLPAEQWSAWRDEYRALMQAPTAAITSLEQVGEQLQAALTELEAGAG